MSQTARIGMPSVLGMLSVQSMLSLLMVSAVTAQTPAQLPPDVAALQTAVKRAIARVEPAVVAIIVRPQADSTRPQSDDPLAGAIQCGTGVLIDRRGLVLTNYHLLGDVRRSQYEIWLPGHRHVSAKIKGADPYSDLAVLEITLDELPAIAFGDTAHLYKGQFVLALGNPYAILNDGGASATWGLVSNRRANPVRDRQARGDDRPVETLYRYGSLVESDATLRLATSGGPLVNLQGEMIGLVTSTAIVAGHNQQATYAIPLDSGIRRVIEQLKQGREPEFGFLGIQVEELARDERRSTLGVRVANVVPGTPADQAGIRVGDQVTHVADQGMLGPDAFLREIALRAPGESVDVTVLRPDSFLGRDRSSQYALKLSKKYVRLERTRVVTVKQRAWRGLVVDYSTAIPDILQQAHLIDSQGCVALVDVRPDSAAWHAGLRKGMFLTHVNAIRVNTPAEFDKAVAHVEDSVTLRVMADDGPIDLIVRQSVVQ